MAEAHEILYWLSGGAGNTDPDASIGGARSTAQQTGFQNRDTSAPFAGLTVLDGSVVDGDGPETMVSLDDSLPDVRIRRDGSGLEITFDVTGGTMTGYTTFGPSTGTERGRIRVTGVYATLFANVPDTGVVTFTTPDNNLLREITSLELISGVVIYRCFYIQNNSAGTLTNYDLWSRFESTGLVDVQVGLDPIGAGGTATTIADEFTAPAGVTFSDDTGTFTLTAGQSHAIWVRLEIFALTTPPAELRSTTNILYGTSLGNPDGQGIFAFTFEFVPLEEELTDTATFTDSVSVTTLWLEDTATFTDSASAEKVMSASITETVTLSHTLASRRDMSASITETVTLSAVLASAGEFHEALEDAIAFFDAADVAGGQREGWTLNLDTNAVSRYLWGPFTSFARYLGHHYAVTNDGVFLLEGDTDDGEEIDAFVLTGLTDLGEEFKKRIKAAYLGVRSTGDLLLKVVVDEETYVYEVRTQGMDALKRARGTVGLGLYGNYWQFGIENVAGVDFELESVKILPLKPIVDGRRKD